MQLRERIAACLGIGLGVALLGASSWAAAQDAGAGPADAGVIDAAAATSGDVDAGAAGLVVTDGLGGEGQGTAPDAGGVGEGEGEGGGAAVGGAGGTSTTSAPPEPSEPAAAASEDLGGHIPLHFLFHGYARTRAVHIGNIPSESYDPLTGARSPAAADANFIYSRLRLEPAVVYGTNPDKPMVALRMQIDGLDNVVWGDNARLARTPLFAGDPSTTDIEGFDVPSIELKRAWLEFLLPVGQLRVGRMPSQWGMGLLTAGGDGFTNDWGDPLFGTTYDRILFATRPITIYNALTSGDARETPLILALAFDKLVEDPLGVRPDAEPAGTRPARPGGGFAFVSSNPDDVQESVLALAWNDPNFNQDNAEKDELAAGAYFVYRTQDYTNSDVFILDGFWRLRWSAFGAHAPALYTEAEVLTIQGTTHGISLNPTFCDDPTGMGCMPGTALGTSTTPTRANIWGGVLRAGVRADVWDAFLEAGWSSGDEIPADDRLTQRPIHPDYHVGLLMYQVAIASLASSALGEDLRPLWPRGGVWNSRYLYPQVKYRIPGIGAELVGAFLLGFADELNQAYSNTRASGETSCGVVDADCFLGWEADVALKMTWGENDLMRWSTEFGLMHAGNALGPTVLAEPWLWTLQSRIAMVF